MNCPNCGLPVADDANFCNHCGKPINQTGPSATLAAEVSEARAKEAAPGAASHYYMGSPPDVVAEQTLWDEYPSMRTAIPAIVLWILGGAAIVVALNFVPMPLTSVIQLGVSAAVAIIVMAVLIRYFIRFHSTSYRLTTQRLFITHGWLNKRTDEVELEKYKDIFVNQNFWNKIVGCGDIEIVTSDITNPTIQVIDVRDPIGKKENIRAAAKDRKSILGITRREEL